MFFRKGKKLSPEDKLRRKIKKKIRNQSSFLKHSIIYLVMLFFIVALAFIINDGDFVLGFSIVFLLWMIGLTFHGLSAFVFNRIDSWEEIKYSKKLNDLRLDEESMPFREQVQDWNEDVMDLKSYERLRKENDERWGEGDFV